MFLVTFPAIDWPNTIWFEGHFSLLTAILTGNGVHFPRTIIISSITHLIHLLFNDTEKKTLHFC